VVSSGDPIEASSRIRKTAFDLALLDYQMPHLTGAQLAQRIKSMKPDVPIVLISGFSALPPFELIFADAHVGRGATLDELLDTMRSLIHSGRALVPPHLKVRPDMSSAELRSAARTGASGPTYAT
jgi:CheY-like chemotaxis protein